MRLERKFFERDGLTVAKQLVGCCLVRKTEKGLLRGRIVETEAYMGFADDAAHVSKGKTERVRALFGDKGCAYIYLIYGMYNCLNISAGTSREKPECILIRAIEPVDGIDIMSENRNTANVMNLCSGPGKLCMAMDIDRRLYGADMVCGDELYIEQGETADVECSKRIGIDYAEKCRDKMWRFTEKQNRFISKKVTAAVRINRINT